MDETGQAGDTGGADSGSGAEARDRGPTNGWTRPDSPWSSAGAALDPLSDVPAWRRPAAEIRPFARDPLALDRPYLNGHPPDAGSFGRNGSSYPPAGSADTTESLSDGPPGDTEGRWSDSRSRYADLVAHLSTPVSDGDLSPDGVAHPDDPRVDDGRTTGELPSPVSAPRYPSSAPPYPYEGDLDDRAVREPLRLVPPLDQSPLDQSSRGRSPAERPAPDRPAYDRTAFPSVRPATPPGGRSGQWSSPGSARHARTPSGDPPTGDPPVPTQPGPTDRRPGDPGGARVSYDPASFPRRLPYEPPQPRPAAYEPADTPGYVPPTPYAAYPPRPADAGQPGEPDAVRALPQRVPAQPDVPTVPEPPVVDSAAETPALARIATHLRRGDVFAPQERQEGFDVQEILAAVREVEGVRDALLRTTPAGANSLRLELSEGADAAEVSRRVARLLQDRMGLDAAMTTPGGPFTAPASAPVSAAPGATRPVSSPPPGPGYAPVPAGFAPGTPSQPQPPVGQSQPGQSQPGRSQPGQSQPGQSQPGQPAPGQSQPGQPPSSPPTSGFGPSQPPPGFVPSQPTPGFVPSQPPPAGRAQVDESTTRRRPFPGGPSGAPEVQPVEARPSVGERPAVDVEPAPPRPLIPGDEPGPRVIIDTVQVNTCGIEATVEVRLSAGERTASGTATGPAVDGYLLRLCAMATVGAVDELLAHSDHADGPARCFVEHAASVPFGATEVAVVVLLLACGGWVEQLAGSALVSGDDRHAMVRATLDAVNRRLEALLS